jgi:protein tyrosine phosphatase
MNCTFNYQECAGKKNILVTQYPLQETVVDFWTMVYDTDSTVVVVLELLNEVCTSFCKIFISNPVIVFRINVWYIEQKNSLQV